MQRRISVLCVWIAATASFLAGLFPFNTTDGYGHLAVGRQIAELGHVPRVDLFSFWKPTPQPWHNFSWGYDLSSWLVYSFGGANALILLKCVALALLGAALVWLAVRLSQDSTWAAPVALTLLLIVLPVVRFRLTVRPQILGLLIPAILLVGLFAIYSDKTSRRNKFLIALALAVTHVVWVNAHGSHLFGLLLTGLFAVFAFRTVAFAPAALLVLLQVVAMGCTPFGYGIVLDSLSLLSRPEYRDLLLEWQPWSPKIPLALLIVPSLYAVLTLVALRPVARSGRFGLAYAVLAVVLTFMAFRSLRFVAHQLLLLTPFIAAGLAMRLGDREFAPSFLLVPLAAAAWALAWSPQLSPFLGFGLGEPRTDYPWVAADVIEREVEQPRVLANVRDGWMLTFAVPGAKFLIDGRVHFFGPEFMRLVEDSFGDERRFARLLESYPVNAVVVDHTIPKHFAATNYLSGSPEWLLAQVEDRHSLFVLAPELDSDRALHILGAGYRVGRLLDPEVTDAQLDTELLLVGDHPSTKATRAWAKGLRTLRPLARDGSRAGFRMFQDPAERQRARDAYGALTEAADIQREFNAIELFRALAASSACDLESAALSLRAARRGGGNRMIELAALELALRGPDNDDRAAALSRLQILKRSEGPNDPWVRAIVADVEAGVRCR